MVCSTSVPAFELLVLKLVELAVPLRFLKIVVLLSLEMVWNAYSVTGFRLPPFGYEFYMSYPWFLPAG